MATTATGGLRDLVFAMLDGGTAAPTAGGGTAITVDGTTQDLLNATICGALPTAVALKLGVAHTTTGTPPQAGTTTPIYQVFAIWMENTTLTPTALDRESILALHVAETTTVTGVTSGAPHTFTPTNVRVIAVKARYLKLRYKINAAAAIAGNINFGSAWAGIYNRSEI